MPHDHDTQTGRPTLAYLLRCTEVVGVLMLLYGLAASRRGVAVVGGGLILMCYTVYRRFFPTAPETENP